MSPFLLGSVWAWAAPLGLLSCLTVAISRADEPKADLPKSAKACIVYYSGKVQGVGFRATAVDISRDYAVTGWVKNLADGRVQLLAEGPPEAVDKFLKAIRTHWQGAIEKEETENQMPTGKFQSFDVVK
jgi:acylphosphatase